MQTIPMVVTLALASVACTVPTARIVREEVPSAPVIGAPSREPLHDSQVDYTYELLRGADTGLAQVFDDGERTFLSFAAPLPPGLMIFDENGKRIAYRAVGNSVVIDAIRRGWLIRTPTRGSYAQTRSPDRIAALEAARGASSAASVLPAELAAARAEVLLAEDRLTGVSADLGRAFRGEPAAPLAVLKGEIEEIQASLDGIQATLLRAHFAFGSAVLALAKGDRRALIEAADRAPWVKLQGGADSVGSPEVNARLALARADALRHFLIEGGVLVQKISTNPTLAEYVASNATAAGRAMNRRVDVYLGTDRREAVHLTHGATELGTIDQDVAERTEDSSSAR